MTEYIKEMKRDVLVHSMMHFADLGQCGISRL